MELKSKVNAEDFAIPELLIVLNGIEINCTCDCYAARETFNRTKWN